MSDMFSYWAKAVQPQAGQATWHLLPYHCLDVAACGIACLQRWESLRKMLCSRLNMTDSQLYAWVGFWLALHDLGKFSTAFQGQRDDILMQLQGRQRQHGYSIRHDTLGLIAWKKYLEAATIDAGGFGPNGSTLLRAIDHWVRAVMGHHGQPPLENDCSSWPHFVAPDHHASLHFVAQMQALFLADMDWQAACFADPCALEDASREVSWWVAGLAVLADWTGSNQTYFPFRNDKVFCAQYWAHSQAQAQKACEAIGVLPVKTRPRSTFAELFPGLAHPSPLQTWASETPLQATPQIHLLEDVTGAGKTEAAMMLTHRLMAAGAADGFFIGLPTMATANAMYGRLSRFYARLFDGVASLVLANGQRELVEAFAASTLVTGTMEHDRLQADETATARCTAWLADHNKRALLAPAGVGTIDQALMAVLQGKHQSLRMLGLFRKVLIVDEVHACDAYMQGVLECLLQAHASAGGSAILLSATLPERMKSALLGSFATGCAGQPPELPPNLAYPLVTSWHATNPVQANTTCVGTRDDVPRTILTRYVSDVNEVVAGIRSALASGCCVCWMRNTIADAVAAHMLFTGELAPSHLMLFHARFTLRDRLDMESRVLAHFGPLSDAKLRKGRLVIATQVAEQSLDADWDWLVSDLAPMDRLIQRAGRLQRHRRDASGNRLSNAAEPDGRPPPCLWVLGPVWSAHPSPTWFKDAFPKSAKVYRHHGQAWLTARLIQEGQISMPSDARRLIEDVFGCNLQLPEGLQPSSDKADGEAMGEASQAHCNTIKLSRGYVWSGEHWWSDAKTPTRLGEASTQVLLCCWDGHRLEPWAPHAVPRHAWAYSAVRMPERLFAEALPPVEPELRKAWNEALQELPDQGKWSKLLPLTQTEQGWTGTALRRQGEQLVRSEWVYDSSFGLLERITANGG